MMTIASDSTAWDATPRDRAVTRGLLNGLGRPRGRFFLVSLPKEIVVGILTLGMRPLWIAAVRLDRWRRYEWLLLGEFALWWHARSGDDRCLALAATAEKHARPRRVLWLPRVMIAIALTTLGVEAWFRGPVEAIIAQYAPFPLGLNRGYYALVLAMGWFGLVINGNLQRARAWAWCGGVSDLMAREGRRPIETSSARASNGVFLAAALAPLIGPLWLLPMLLSLAHHNAVVRSFRPAKLRLVERMLERMDSSEWQIEYDVEAMHAKHEA